MSLNTFQKNFKATMLRPLAQLDETAPQFDDVFISDHIPLNERLKIYHNNVLGSLAKTIQAAYPLLVDLVGEDFLKNLAREFIIENPPQSACLHHYGEGFDTFLKNHKSCTQLPYLPDMAKMEWALHNAYHAADDSPMSAEDLGNIPPEALAGTKLKLRGSVSLIASPYPLQALRNMCQKKTDDTPDMDKDHKTKLMIWRQKLETNILSLEDDEYQMLSHINNGLNLGEAIEQTLADYRAFDFASFLQKHIVLETFSES